MVGLGCFFDLGFAGVGCVVLVVAVSCLWWLGGLVGFVYVWFWWVCVEHVSCGLLW